MTPAALPPASSTRQGARTVHFEIVRLPLPELLLLYGLVYAAHPLGTRISSTAAAGEGDAAAVLLHQVTCRLYVALYDATVRGGL